MDGFDQLLHPRVESGRFSARSYSGPEISLSSIAGHPRGSSFAVVRPDLVEWWHPTKNGSRTPDQVSAGSTSFCWWLCVDCGHEWQGRAGHMRDGHGCQPCGVVRAAKSRATPKPGASLVERFPDIARELHPTRNSSATGSNTNAGAAATLWWICDSGHEWQASVEYRTSRGSRM